MLLIIGIYQKLVRTYIIHVTIGDVPFPTAGVQIEARLLPPTAYLNTYTTHHIDGHLVDHCYVEKIIAS